MNMPITGHVLSLEEVEEGIVAAAAAAVVAVTAAAVVKVRNFIANAKTAAADRRAVEVLFSSDTLSTAFVFWLDNEGVRRNQYFSTEKVYLKPGRVRETNSNLCSFEIMVSRNT